MFHMRDVIELETTIFTSQWIWWIPQILDHFTNKDIFFYSHLGVPEPQRIHCAKQNPTLVT